MKLRRLRRESRKLKAEATSRYLGDGNAALPGQLLFRLLAGVRVGQVRVEIFVEDLRSLLAEVAALATRVQETASGNSRFGVLEAKVELVRTKCFKEHFVRFNIIWK